MTWGFFPKLSGSFVWKNFRGIGAGNNVASSGESAIAGVVAYNNHKLKKEATSVNSDEDGSINNKERFHDLQVKSSNKNNQERSHEMQIEER